MWLFSAAFLGSEGVTFTSLNNLDGDAELESANFFPTFVESIVKGKKELLKN